MALNKYATIRYRVIDRCIRSRSHPFPSKEKLRQACEEELFGSGTGEHISISTIEKDLWTLRNESSLGYAPIAYNKAENGYFYTDSDFSLDLPLTEDDIELIRLATSTLSQFKDSQVFKNLESSVEKIRGRLKVYHQMDSKENTQLIRFETAPHFTGSNYLSEILDAINDHKEIEIEYIPFTDDTARKYSIHPYFLQEHKNRWYLICFDKESKKFRTLGLDRFRKMIPKEIHFQPDPGFDPENYYKYSFGIGIYSGKPVEVSLSFDSVQGRYIKAQPIHTTQKILKETNDELIIRICVIPSPEFMMHLMSYGSSVKVLEPSDIREELISLLNKALSRYNK